MGSVLTLAVSAYFFIISYRLEFTYFVFVFLLPFLPPYLGFGVGGEGFALSLRRILIMILFISFVVSFTQNGKYISKRISHVYKYNKILINTLLLFLVVKVISLSFNGRETSQYIMLINDSLFSIFILILTTLLINSEETIHRLAKILFYGYTIVLILALLGYILQYPLFGIFASDQISLQGDHSAGGVRDGSYRVRASFINSIQLGEYLIVLFPIIISYMYRNKYSLVLKIVYFLSFLFAIYSTGSRSAILMIIILAYFYIILTLYQSNRILRFFIKLFNLIIVGVAFYYVYNFISNLVMNFHGRFDLLPDADTMSSTSRALQFVNTFDKMKEAPFIGFGRMRNFTSILESAIDNYYIWTILEVGIIGILLYLFFFFTLVKTALNLYKLPNKIYYLLPLMLAIIMGILYQVMMQNPGNHIYLYIFAGVISAMKVLQNEGKYTLKT